jgi:hypothetical protein
MTRARDVSRLITTPPNIYATDTESSAGFLSLSSASTIYQGSPNRNLIINGAMQVAQRATSVASITSSGYNTADRYRVAIATQGTWTQSVENDAPTGSGFRKSLKMLCTTADASPAAGDEISIQQNIEGQNIQHIKKGTAAAEQLTLSFWVKSNVTGTYVVNIADVDNSREVSKSYTINASGVWEYKTITFPADTTGAFDNDNALSLSLSFGLGAGSNYTSGTLQQTWAANTAANRFVGQTNLASATNNYWQVTGVQLEVGDTATPFEFKSFAQDLTECKRYYEKSYSQGVNPGTSTTASSIRFRAAASSVEIGLNFSVTKRAAPTVTLYSTTGASGNIRDLSTSTNGAASGDTIGDSWFFATKTTGGTAGNSYAFHYAAEIEL